MKPSDLYREVAEQEARELHGGQLTPERQRGEEAAKNLGFRAAIIMDQYEQRWLDKELSGDMYFSVRSWTQYLSADSRQQLMVTKRILKFSQTAPGEIEDLLQPDENKEVLLEMVFGTHDLKYSGDGGKTWQPPRLGASIDALTMIKVVGNENTENVVQRVERLDSWHPVFVDKLYAIKPEEHYSPSDRMHQIEGLHAALDIVEDMLDPV